MESPSSSVTLGCWGSRAFSPAALIFSICTPAKQGRYKSANGVKLTILLKNTKQDNEVKSSSEENNRNESVMAVVIVSYPYVVVYN